MMISNLDVFRSAKLLVNQHGAEAPIEAAMHADAMLAKGDLDTRAVWMRIVKPCLSASRISACAADKTAQITYAATALTMVLINFECMPDTVSKTSRHKLNSNQRTGCMSEYLNGQESLQQKGDA